MYSRSFAPTILIFGLYQAFILGIMGQICQKESLFVVKLGTPGIPRNDDIGPVVATSNVQSSHAIIRMERFYLSVQQAVFLNGCVAVNSPNQAVGILASLMRLFAEHGWSWPPVDLNVSL